MLLSLSLAKSRAMNPRLRTRIVTALRSLPERVNESLQLKDKIKEIAPKIASKENALYLLSKLENCLTFSMSGSGPTCFAPVSYTHLTLPTRLPV